MQSKKFNSGTTFIEALTVLFIFSLITVTFYSVFSVGTRYIQEAKNKLSAISVANERMEIVRNLKYDDIGTVGGSVPGVLPINQDVAEGGRLFHIHTEVGYIDDELDGKAGGDANVVPADYKKVTLTISWENGDLTASQVSLTSRFVPPGLEQANPGDGILSINVFSDQPGGAGIPGSLVHIVNSDIGLDISQTTDSSGNVLLMGSHIQNSIQKYHITVTKAGYETAQTFPPFPETSYDPIDTHASVVTGSVNVAYIVQNPLVGLKIKTVDNLDQPIANIDFSIKGGRKMDTGSSPDPMDGVFNLTGNEKTGSDGEKDFGPVSPGEYEIKLIEPALSNYELINTSRPSPFSLMSADGSLEFRLKLVPKNSTALLVKVLTNEATPVPISGASVKLVDSLGVEVIVESGEGGEAFFPQSSDPLVAGTYQLKVTADGFSENNSSVEVENGVAKIVEVKMDAS